MFKIKFSVFEFLITEYKNITKNEKTNKDSISIFGKELKNNIFFCGSKNFLLFLLNSFKNIFARNI